MGCSQSIYSIENQPKIIKCQLCQEQNQKLLKLIDCNHFYHTQCLIKRRMDSKYCHCQKLIGQLNKINEFDHHQFFTQQVQTIFQNNQNKFVRCPKKDCAFYFIYVDKLNPNKITKFFCDLCNCMHQIDEQIVYNNYDNKENQNKTDELRINNKQSQNKYQQQLNKIIQSTILTIKFCKNNCGYMYIENNNYDINNNLCLNCDFCHKCNNLLFSDFIPIKKCNHNFHFLCAFMLIDNNNLKQLKCNCGQLIDDEETKIKLNIICMICGKYDDNLKLLDCQHYIHLNCIHNHSSKFCNSKCYICQISIFNFLSNPDHKYINDSIKLLQQIQNDYQICLNQSSENTQFNHQIHQTCLNKTQVEIQDQRYLYPQSLCGQQIINICQIAK